MIHGESFGIEGEPLEQMIRREGRRNSILVVDDSPELLEWMKFDLEDRGFEVACALSGEECIDRVRQAPPACILLDVMMPGSPSFVDLMDRNEILLRQGTILLNDSLFCFKDGVREPLYEALCSEPKGIQLLRVEGDGPSTLQRASSLYEIVRQQAFIENHGVAQIHLDGYATCQLLKSCKTYEGIGIVLFTAGGAGSKNERAERAKRAGASSYILKSEYYTALFEAIEVFAKA